MRSKKNHRFRNWAGNEECRPAAYFQPETEDDMIRIVKQAAAEGRQVRVAGAGHSWSPVACTTGFMLNLDHYNRVIAIDAARRRVTVQAGIRLKHLNRVLDENGLSLINLGSVSEQSVAGATATGTHGTGIGFQIISSAIIAMKVVCADGSVMVIGENHPLLNCFRLNLGALGIISEVTLQCADRFTLREDSSPMLMEEALEQMDVLVRNNDHVKFWWFPHVNRLMVYRFQRTQEPARPAGPISRWVEEVLVARFVFALLLRAGNLIPAAIPRINRFISLLHLKRIRRVGKSHNIFNVSMPPRHRESEYAVPVSKAAAALRELRDEIERRGLKVNFVVEVRFVKGDDIWLSPAYGRDSCYIGGYLYGDKRWSEYFRVFENIMVRHNGRPHWGKEFTPALHDFPSLYPRWNDFIRQRQMMDSKNRFGNLLTEKIFGTKKDGGQP